MKKLVFIITCSIIFATGVAAESIFTIFNNRTFPEERNQVIHVDNLHSILEPSQMDGLKDFSDSVFDTVNTLLANKFELGNGFIDVTNQVHSGVKSALKETFTGYAEYQRRKATEEILNSNFYSHQIANQFLLGSSVVNTPDTAVGSVLNNIFSFFSNLFNLGPGFNNINSPNILSLINHINSQSRINDLYQLFQNLSRELLLTLGIFIIFLRLIHNDFNYSITEPLFAILLSFVGIGLIGPTLDALLILVLRLSAAINTIFANEWSSLQLENSWQGLANQIGYMPTIVLSIIDILSQFFTYFFIVGLILYIVIGKIISPFWALCFIDQQLRSNAINSIINWFKILLVLTLIPIVYLVINYIAVEFSNLGLYFLEIVLSIAAFLFLPFLSAVLLSRTGGVAHQALGGYQIMIDSLNAAYWGLRDSFDRLIDSNNNHVPSNDRIIAEEKIADLQYNSQLLAQQNYQIIDMINNAQENTVSFAHSISNR